MRGDIVWLKGLARFDEIALWALRTLTGAFLIYGVWDNITEPAHMDAFVAFLTAHGFPEPHLMAPLSVWTQFAAGLGLVLGLFTRWAGVLVIANFVVAVAMVHWSQSFRDWWPAIVLVAIGLVYATRGGGRWSLDRLVFGRVTSAA